MSELIDRQQALDIFDDYNVSVEYGELEAYSRDRKRLCELPTVQLEPQWIMFAKYYNTPKWNNSMWLKESDKMFVSVEIPGNEFIVDTAKMIDGKWFFGLSFVDKKVIAWMPLPKPFEGGIK